jgi:hypothetical protein
VQLGLDDLYLFNPSTGTCPTFKSERDLKINRQIYKAGKHILIDKNNCLAEPLDFLGELFNMTRDSSLFIPSDGQVRIPRHAPLFEAKAIHQFDHRYARLLDGAVEDCTQDDKLNPLFQPTPKSHVSLDEAQRRLAAREVETSWLIGFRSVSSATNERTAIFAVFPVGAVGNSINLVLGLTATQGSFLLANGNSLAFDYACREKMSGMNVNIWIVKQLPAIAFEAYEETCCWAQSALSLWIIPRAMELTYTAWDLEPFARDCGYEGPPFRWDEERRFLMRCELDAAYFHLYGIARDDVDYILETFPIVKRKDIARHGDYRTKLTILRLYDALAEATATGRPYQTPLDPPPGPPTGAAGQFVPVSQWDPGNWPPHVHRPR